MRYFCCVYTIEAYTLGKINISMSFQFIHLIILGFVVVSILTFCVPFFSNFSNSMKNIAPYTDYTYTNYANTSGAIANSTQNATITRNIAEGSDSNIAKTETLSIKIQNSGDNDLIAKLYFNGVFIENMTAHNTNNDTYSGVAITCINGVNRIQVGGYSAGNNITYTNSTLSCATTLNGTDYSWIIDISFLAIGIFGLGLTLAPILVALRKIK